VDEETPEEMVEKGHTGAHRVGTSSAVEHPANLSKAIKVAVMLLSDCQWHKAARLKRIARLYGVTYDTLSLEAGLAESKTGRWCCLGDEDVPVRAPDE
jgi:hypothetical protein